MWHRDSPLAQVHAEVERNGPFVAAHQTRSFGRPGHRHHRSLGPTAARIDPRTLRQTRGGEQALKREAPGSRRTEPGRRCPKDRIRRTNSAPRVYEKWVVTPQGFRASPVLDKMIVARREGREA